MLFATLTTEIRSSIATHEAEILRLQEQVAALQAHLQEVGTITAAAESAVNQARTAAQMINAVSPDEIAEFTQAVLTAIQEATGQSVAKLAPPSDDDYEQVEGNEPPIDGDVVEVWSEEVAESADEEEPASDTANGNGNGHYEVKHEDLLLLGRKELKKLAKGRIKGITSKTLEVIIDELLQLGVSRSDVVVALNN
ncbi:MAG: hypothetical protein NVS2B14_00590 [Chamaesiphon sp.]